MTGVAGRTGMRIKSHWFKAGEPKSAEQNASAMAFIVWRVAHNMLKRMRGANFDVAAGVPYFAFLREVLVFLIAVVDRTAYTKMDAAARTGFTTALVLHCADTLAGNETDLLGPRSDGDEAQQQRGKELLHSARAGTMMSRLPLVDMLDTSPDFSICSSSRAARL